jgi:hypothetical protein
MAEDDEDGANVRKGQERTLCCALIIDAEKGNKALRIVALIRHRTGSGPMAFTAE